MKKREITATITNEDIDHNKHAHYATYIRLYEAGHDDFLVKLAGGRTTLEHTYSIRTFVRAITIEYFEELFVGDKVTVCTNVSKLGTTSITYYQEIRKGKDVVSRATTTVVVVDEKTRKKTAIPTELRRIIEKSIQSATL